MPEEPLLSPDQSLRVILRGTPDTAKTLLKLFTEEFTSLGERFRIDEPTHGEIGPGLMLRARDQGIGWIFLIPLPGQRTLLRVPVGRGSPGSKWEADPDGALVEQFLHAAFEEFKQYGLLSNRSQFKSDEVLETAIRQLGGADDSAAYAAIGNICRTALIALGKELFSESMLNAGEEPPHGDDANARLKYVARFYWGAHSKRQLEGIKKIIDGTWITAAAFLHRKSATLEEAELCIGQIEALFDSLALLVPKQ